MSRVLMPRLLMDTGASPTAAQINAVNFDGTNDYLHRNGGLTGAVDGKLFTYSTWILKDTGFTKTFNMTGDAMNVGHAIAGTDLTIVMRNAAGTQIYTSGNVNTTPDLQDGNWHHLHIALDLGNGLSVINVDGVSISHSPTITDDDINWTTANTWIGANAGTSLLNGSLAEFWVDDSYVPDVTKFRSAAGLPVDLGASGETPTGSSPLIFFSGATATWHENKGTGGGFTEVGALTDADTSPSD